MNQHMKKKPAKKPKPRNVWQINPKSRVEENKKVYSRPAAKKDLKRRIFNKLDWFGAK